VTIDAQGLGPVLDLATAIGLVTADQSPQLDPDWFTDPGGRTGQMLRDPGQREALLRAASSTQRRPAASVSSWPRTAACR